MGSRSTNEPEPDTKSGEVINFSLTIEGIVACEKLSTLLRMS
jgi:hypothetical protein